MRNKNQIIFFSVGKYIKIAMLQNFERIKTFDAVRAVATMAVFLFHAGYLLPFYSDSVTDYFSPVTFINLHKLVYVCGTVGVSIFFVLSGFLLFYQMYKGGEQMDAKKLKDYIRKRLLRILPLYYFSIFFIVFIFRQDILFADGGIKAIIYNLFFIRGIHADGASKITINPVYWSLIIEMHFYFILPIFYYFFYKYQKILWFLMLAVMGIAYRSILVLFVSNPTMQLLRFTPADLDFFAFGMMGAYFYVRYNRRLEFLGRNYFQWTVLAAFFLFIYFYNLNFSPTIAYVFAPTLLGAITTLVIISFLINERSFLVRTATCWPILFIARISFSVYIWHAILIGQIEHLAINNLSKFFLSIISTLALATATYYLVEAPFLKIKSKKQSHQ